MSGRRRYIFVTAIVAGVLLSHCAAWAAPSAVALHEPELSASATVWCLDNKILFAHSARAVGLDIGTAGDGTEFDRPGHRTINLEEWSVSPDLADVEDFNAACLPAYEAFSPSGSSGGESGEDNLTTFLSVLLGAGLATASSVGVERWRANKRDADELRRIGLELRETVGEYIAKPTEVSAQDRAKTTALKLCSVLVDFDSEAPKDVSRARASIDKLLTGSPRIGNLGSDTTGVTLMGYVSDARSHVEKVAKRASHPLRSRVIKQRA